MFEPLLSGIVITVLAGLVMGTSPWPLKLMRRFQYEHFALVSMLFSLGSIPGGQNRRSMMPVINSNRPSGSRSRR